MRRNEIEAAVRDFLVKDLLYDRALGDLSVEDSLLERGLLDSMGILRLVEFCEVSFGVSIPDQDVVPDNLESVQAIARLVERCRASSGSA
jgi:acyl carrier protein